MKNRLDPVLDTVLSYAKENGFSLDGRILLGLSGGADSTCLLLLLLAAGAEPVCVHVNHGIRGAEADRDEEFCRALCEKYGVEFRSYHIDVPALSAERHTGLEETARDERHRILKAAAKEFSCDKIALAHNKNDRAETFLFNLARGAGTKGLGSIRPVRADGDITYIRPVMCLTKDEITAYLDGKGQTYVTDSTNADTDYTRNYIRRELLPLFERINPSYLSNINKAADISYEADGFIEECALRYLSENGSVSKADAAVLNKALFKKILSLLYERLCGEALSDVHLSSILAFAPDAENGQRLQLPSGVDFICENGVLHFIKREETAEYELELVPGENKIPGKDAYICIENADNSLPTSAYINIYKIVKRVIISSDIIKSGVFVRSRRDSDSILYGNMTHTVKKLLSEKKVPSSQRRGYPVVTDGENLLFVPPWAVRDGIKGDGLIYLTYCETRKEKNEQT